MGMTIDLSEDPMAATVSKSALKARMLEFFREVETSGEDLVVTSHGQPVLRIVPYRRQETVEEVFRGFRGTVRLPPDDELTAPLPADTFADSDLGALL